MGSPRLLTELLHVLHFKQSVVLTFDSIEVITGRCKQNLFVGSGTEYIFKNLQANVIPLKFLRRGFVPSVEAVETFENVEVYF